MAQATVEDLKELIADQAITMHVLIKENNQLKEALQKYQKEREKPAPLREA